MWMAATITLPVNYYTFRAVSIFPRSLCHLTSDLLTWQTSWCRGVPIPSSLDLSKAIKLEDVEFLPSQPNVKWISAALRTIKSKNLRQITICLGGSIMSTVLHDPVDETSRLRWRDLDNLLIQLWTTHSIRPVFRMEGMDSSRALVPKLLPELARRGVIDKLARRGANEL